MRVVFDTNIFISTFIIPGSQAERAYFLAQKRHFGLYTSVPILTETATKLRNKFGQSEEDIKQAPFGSSAAPPKSLSLLPS